MAAFSRWHTAATGADNTVNTLEIERRSPHVTGVWLNRPDVRNAFNETVIAELASTFDAIAADPDVRVVVLGGRGKAFCAGADLNWMRALADYDWTQNRDDAGRLADMLATIDRCPVPIVGRIHGDCYAGGLGLAAVCDVRIASEGATFCLSEARLGLLPATISPYVVRAMGEQAARRYFVTAERFDAGAARSIGFVHEVAAAGAIDAEVDRVVAAIVANGPMATRACKQLVRDVAGREITAELRAETARRIADIRASAEGKEGIRSFLEKRKPGWLDPQPDSGRPNAPARPAP
jgi:methylglutaconyl-CoA hydratase